MWIGFLEVRASQECIEFRSWLRNLDDFTDAELHRQVSSVRTKLGISAHSPSDKVIRLAITTGVGLVPVVGPLLGLAASSLDSFLADELLREDGPTAFLTRLYPSMFSADT
jgi:hypothetical protein